MKKQLMTLAAMMLTLPPAFSTAADGAASEASESPLWLRHVAISPDGSRLAFTYKGDIFTVGVNGGRARQLTSNPAIDAAPVWTPDGRRIVFQSMRQGSADLYIVNAEGGTARRLTTHSGSETPLAFANDSVLLFSANVQISREASQGPFQAQLYEVNVDRQDARPVQVMSLPALAADVDPSGRMLYQDRKGFENVFRKHERSSGTSDIWLADNGRFTRLTDFNGHDLNPRWNAAGDGFYFVSEEDGTLNVYERSLDGKTSRQLTHFTNHPVRSLSAAGNGTLAFSWDGEIYTLVPGQDPRRVEVSVVTDDLDPDLVKRYITSGASDFVPSPSGKEVAFVARGDLYVTNTKYRTTKRVTNTAGQERSFDFAPDGRSIVYDSERDDNWKIYITRIKADDEKEFAYATDLAEELLYESAVAAQQPQFSPDGKKVAFLENRTELKVIDLDTKKVTTALPGKYNYSYTDGDVQFDWSPDSRWLLISYIGVGGWNNVDIAMVKADGTEVVDLTESGYSDAMPRWAMGGKAVTYSTGKYGMRSHGSWGNQEDVMIMFLDGEAWDEFRASEEEAALIKKEREDKEKADSDKKKDADKKKDKKKGKDAEASKDSVKPLEFDLANRKYRRMRLTPNSDIVGDYFLSPDGEKFYYTLRSHTGDIQLMVRDLRKGDTRVLVGSLASYGIAPDAKGENLFVYMPGGISKVALPGGDVEGISYEAIYERHPSLEREYIYDHMLKQVREKFYDAGLHGVDWEGYGEHYRKFLPYINNNSDFADLLSEILGELNASHTGASAYTGGASMATADLGAFFDDGYTGDGLLVTEVLPRSPLATKKAHVAAGDIITAIDGEPVLAGKDYYPLLEGKGGRKTRLTVKRASGATETVEVVPSSGQTRDMLYQRWVEHNQAVVDSISGGRIGYVHIQGMNSPSYREIFDQILGKYRNREAIVVDTRYNGGGWLHNDVAILLSGKEYVRFTPRGQYIGSEPFSQWTKPSVMLVNESNYSDAHGTPYTYQALGIGDVVGAPIPGTMTAVWWENQIDPAITFGIPQVTSMSPDGTVLENHQLNPDVVIYNNPGDVISGRDSQLEGAVRHLLDKLGDAR